MDGLRALVVVLAAALIGGCAAGGPDTDDTGLPSQAIWCTGATIEAAQLEHVDVAPEFLEAENAQPDSVCSCPDMGCVKDWIEDHFGCDLCVHFSCGPTSVGACATCAPDPVDTHVDGDACLIPAEDPLASIW